MKFMFLLAFLGIFTLSAKVYSQGQAITIHLQNATLHDLFKSIEKQTDYRFFYNDELVGINKMVTIDVSDMTIDAILGQLLENTGLKYRRMDNNLIVVSSSALLQQSTVSGTVKDAAGVTMPGVNISIKGTTHGVVTDANGRYSINVPNADAILVFSFVGYLTKEIIVGNQTVVDIEMGEDMQQIEEVVVVGYGSQKKVNLTGSVASIDAKAIENKSFRNVQQAIQGQIPGLTVVQGHGQPGNETMDMNIRGVSTFSSNAPLVIVDGQAISMANLNPQDIESVSVLKDAAAAAIYGARASGGVILVTTKKGQPGKVKISYDGYVGVQDAACFPDIVNAYDHARLFREAEYNDNPNTTTYTWSLEQIEEFRTGVRPSASRPDYLFNPAFMTQHNISVSGGTEFNTFMVSLGYMKQNGVMRNTGFERFNIRITDQFRISKKLSVDIMANFVPSQRNAPSEATYPSGPTRRIYDIIGSAYRRPSALPIFTSDGQWASVTAWANRFGLASEQGGFQDRQFNRLNGSLSLNWDIIDGLKFKGSYFGKYDHTRQVDFSKRMKFISPEDLTTVHFDYNTNSMLDFNQSNYEHNLQGLLTYEKVFAEVHQFSLLAGTSMEWSNDYQETVGRRNFLTDDIYVINAGSSDPSVWTTSGTASDWAIRSFFGRLNYSYNNRYLFEANLRYDGSSRFHSNVRWGLFPSFSAGWRISEESFFSKEVISNLKLRASWGQVGNQSTSALYQYYSTVGTSAYYFGGTPNTAAYYNKSVNKDLTWETKTTTNIGIDVGLFNNKLTLSLDGFKDRTDDILMTPAVPSTFGMGAPIMNVGTVDNIGWEAILGYRDAKGDFSWGVTLQVSDAKNKVKSMIGSPQISGNYITEVGYEMNVWYGYECEGIFSNDEQVKNHAFQNVKTGIGDLMYRNADGNESITSTDRVRLGSSRPRFPFGANFEFAWNGFDFSAFMQGVAYKKTYISSFGLPLPESLGTLHNQHKDRWHQDDNGDWIPGKYPKLRIGGINVGTFSSFWLQNAAYLRIKNIQLGYTIPSHITNKIKLSKVRVYVNAENLFTFTKMVGVDPEFPFVDRYPLAKIGTFGLNVIF